MNKNALIALVVAVPAAVLGLATHGGLSNFRSAFTFNASTLAGASADLAAWNNGPEQGAGGEASPNAQGPNAQGPNGPNAGWAPPPQKTVEEDDCDFDRDPDGAPCGRYNAYYWNLFVGGDWPAKDEVASRNRGYFGKITPMTCAKTDVVCNFEQSVLRPQGCLVAGDPRYGRAVVHGTTDDYGDSFEYFYAACPGFSDVGQRVIRARSRADYGPVIDAAATGYYHPIDSDGYVGLMYDPRSCGSCSPVLDFGGAQYSHSAAVMVSY